MLVIWAPGAINRYPPKGMVSYWALGAIPLPPKGWVRLIRYPRRGGLDSSEGGSSRVNPRERIMGGGLVNGRGVISVIGGFVRRLGGGDAAPKRAPSPSALSSTHMKGGPSGGHSSGARGDCQRGTWRAVLKTSRCFKLKQKIKRHYNKNTIYINT